MCAWGVFALAGITGVSKMAASAVHADSVALLQTAKPPIVASFDAAHLSATELRKRAGGIHIADSVERLQILRREQHTTRLEWLDAKKAVVTGEDSPDTRTSPFVGHSGLSAGDVSDSYSIVAYSPNGRLLVRVQTSEGSTVAQPGGSVASVIDTESGQLILSIRAHSADDMIQGVAFSPQGSYLVVSSRFRPVQTHTAAPVWGVWIHGDKDGIAEETTVVAGRDGVVRNNLAIWHVNTGRLSAAWCTHHHWNPDRWPYVHVYPSRIKLAEVNPPGPGTARPTAQTREGGKEGREGKRKGRSGPAARKGAGLRRGWMDGSWTEERAID